MNIFCLFFVDRDVVRLIQGLQIECGNWQAQLRVHVRTPGPIKSKPLREPAFGAHSM